MKKVNFIKYLNNLYLFYLNKNYKLILKKRKIISLNYYYWLYRKLYIRDSEGLIINISFKRYNFLISFLLYLKYKNVEINQLYFSSSPFNLLLKFKSSQVKKHKLYIL